MTEIKNGKIYIDHDKVIEFGLVKFKNYFKFARMKNMKWEITATYPNVEAVNKVFKTELAIEEKKGNIDVTKFLIDSKHKFKLEPFKHQLEALAKCGSREFYAYFLEPGLGKTKTAIDDAVILYEKGKVDTVLVVCPISAMSVWKREIANNSNAVISCWPEDPANDRNLRFYIINHDALVSKAVNRTKTIKKLEGANDKKEIKKLTDKVKEIEGNKTDGFSVASKFLMSSSRCMMIIDESTCICNWKSLRTEYCTKLGEMTQYRRILTGTPIANNPIDLYSQLYWLDPTTVRNRSYYAFRNHFCDLGGFKGKQIVGYKNLSELINMCKQHGHRVRTEDVLDMPPQNWLVRRILPDQKTLDLYNQIVQEDLVKYLDKFDDEFTIDVSMVLTQMIKLQQVCGGTLLDEDKNLHIVGNEKLKELLITLEELGDSKVLIWHQFKGESTIIADALQKKRKSIALFNGDVSANERGEIVASFERGEIDYLIIQSDAGHLSVTLNKAKYAIWYSNHLRPIVREQSERRNWRIGQKSPIFYIDILMDGLIDNWIYERLKRKRNFNANITDAKMTKKEIMNAVYGKE